MPPPPGPLTTAIVAQRTFHSDAPDAEHQVVFAAAAGAIYGLDAASGKVLWRKFVGWNPRQPHGGSLPCAVAAAAGGDVVLAADGHREIQRIEAATGRIRWRHAIKQDFSADPVAADGSLLLATLGGRLLMIDPPSGESSGFVQLPQPLCVAPAVDARRELVFQLADEENLFVLTMPEGRCRQVFPLGHQPGAIATPPVLWGDYLLVAVNQGAGDSSLKVLKIESAGDQAATPLLRLAQTIAMKGHVDAAPATSDNRVLLATDAGEVHVLDLAPSGAREPLREASVARLEGGPGLVRFPLLRGDRCFIAGDKLASFDRTLGLVWADPSPGPAAQAPLAVGPTIFHVQCAAAMPGIVVSAVNADKGDLDWQTCLAAPWPPSRCWMRRRARSRWRPPPAASSSWTVPIWPHRPPPSRRRPGRRPGCAGP